MEPVLLRQDAIVRAGVAVFVFRRDEFIMLKRQGSHGAGTWCLPGGWIDFGELPEEAARREVLEETGMDSKHECVIGYTSDVFHSEGKHGLTMFVRSVWSGEGPSEPEIKEPDKATEVGWFAFGRLPQGPLFMPFTKFLNSTMRSEVEQFAIRDQPEGWQRGFLGYPG